ncbi:MAG: hypothetical protein RML72_07825 [Bacteroidia bacterium]|nr:hypothetical protein [Bacteroidia bacterium]MDW8158767.1 hypothetical protein [Bacteroidia bacterium]
MLLNIKLSLIATWRLLVILGSSISIATAQTNVTSPYSGFGIGDLQRSVLSRNFALGGAGNAFADPFAINPNNPASFASLQMMTLDFSASGLLNHIKSHEQSVTLNTIGLYGLGFVFKKQGPFAIAAGLSPYSTIGYKFSNIATVEADSLQYASIQTGQGGIIDYYLGAAYQLLKKKLNLGLAMHYLDGKVDLQSITQVPFTFAKVFVREQSFGGLSYQMGAIFSDTLKIISRETFYRIGAIIEFAPAIRFTESSALYQYRNLLDITTQSVPLNPKELRLIQPLSEPSSQTFSLPIKYSWGLAIEKFLHYSIGLDIQAQDWKDFRLRSANESLGLSLSICAGGEWIPNFQDSKSLFARTAYRIGGGWENTYLKLKGQPIQAWHFTLGIGFPLNIRIPSRINLGLEIKQRGTLEKELIRETNYRFVIGINFNEIWFGQRKYN